MVPVGWDQSLLPHKLARFAYAALQRAVATHGEACGGWSVDVGWGRGGDHLLRGDGDGALVAAVVPNDLRDAVIGGSAVLRGEAVTSFRAEAVVREVAGWELVRETDLSLLVMKISKVN